MHPRCAQGQGQGQRSRDTRTFLDSWNELLRHWRSGYYFHKTVVSDGLMFYPWCFFSFATKSPRFLGWSPWNFATWSQSKVAEFYKASPKLGGRSPKTFGAKNMPNFGRLYTTSEFDREYIRNKVTKMSKIGKTCDREHFLPRSTKKVEMGIEPNPNRTNRTRTLIFESTEQS